MTRTIQFIFLNLFLLHLQVEIIFATPNEECKSIHTSINIENIQNLSSTIEILSKIDSPKKSNLQHSEFCAESPSKNPEPVCLDPNEHLVKINQELSTFDPVILDKVNQSLNGISIILKSLSLLEKQEIRLGFARYLSDRKLRRKTIKTGDLDHLFEADLTLSLTIINTIYGNNKTPYRSVRVNQIRPQEISFYEKLVNSTKGVIHLDGEEGVIHAVKGFEGVTEATHLLKIKEKQYYFKRLPARNHQTGEINTPAATGKRMAAEVAGFRLSELLGLDLVPKTEFVLHSFKTIDKTGKTHFKSMKGSLQESVPKGFRQAAEFNDQPGGPTALLYSKKFETALADAEVFNFLGTVVDRHAGNLFLNTETGQIRSIDHETGFNIVFPKHTAENLLMKLNGIPKKINKHTAEKIRNLKFEEIKNVFQDILTPGQIEGVWLRVIMLKTTL